MHLNDSWYKLYITAMILLISLMFMQLHFVVKMNSLQSTFEYTKVFDKFFISLIQLGYYLNYNLKK